MLETYWILIPNIIATIFLMFHKSFYSNLAYSIGYPIMFYHNMTIGDPIQMKYFALLELMSIVGVISYLYKIWLNPKKV